MPRGAGTIMSEQGIQALVSVLREILGGPRAQIRIPMASGELPPGTRSSAPSVSIAEPERRSLSLVLEAASSYGAAPCRCFLAELELFAAGREPRIVVS